MLTLDLSRLRREEEPLHLHETVAAASELFRELDLPFKAGLTVDLRVSLLSSGEVVARGSFDAVLDRKCRRCLEPMDVEFHRDLTLLFTPEEDLEGESEEVRTFDATGGRLELREAIREEVLLSAPRYVECAPGCRGLCPQCGVNLNETSCACTRSEGDPRWDKLRELITD